MSEFINPLSNSICVFAGEYDKFRKFTEDVLDLKGNKDGSKDGVEDKKKDKKVEKKNEKK